MKAFIDDCSKAEKAELRALIWQSCGLRLRYVCREREGCSWVLKRNTAKAGRVNGAHNILARFQRVSEALYWASVYSVKKGK